MHKDQGVITQFLLVFGQPCFGVLYDRYQVKPDQEVGSAPARTIPQFVCFLLLGIGPLASASQIHEFLESGRTSGYWWVKPWIILGLDIYHRSHLGVWLAQNLVGTFVYMV